jgi:hypothetical protein
MYHHKRHKLSSRTILGDLELVASLLEQVAGVLTALRAGAEGEEGRLLQSLLALRQEVVGLGLGGHGRRRQHKSLPPSGSG